MARYALRRIIALVPTLFGVSIAVMALVHLVPGTVVEQMLGTEGVSDPQAMAALRHFFGLDQPLYLQYLRWLGQLSAGDLGQSWRTNQPVLASILSHFSVSAELAFFSMLVAVLMGVPLGIYAAMRQKTATDSALRVLSLAGLSVPVFWQGSMLLLVLSLVFHWIPPVIYSSWSDQPLVNLKIMLLPALTLGTSSTAVIMRMSRSAFLEVLRQDYVRTARAKGLGERVVLYRHALRNAMIPILTVIGLQLGYVLGGVVVVEQVFTLPGLGSLVIQAIFERDYPVVQGGVLFIAVVGMLLNLTVDLAYGLLDPRVQYH